MCYFEQLSDKKKMARKGISDPVLKTMPKVTGSVIFAPPEKVEVIGSFASRTITTLNPTIDVMMILPEVCIDINEAVILLLRTDYLHKIFCEWDMFLSGLQNIE